MERKSETKSKNSDRYKLQDFEAECEYRKRDQTAHNLSPMSPIMTCNSNEDRLKSNSNVELNQKNFDPKR